MASGNPFVGPKPLTASQPLFGRAKEVRELSYLLTSDRIVLLHSPSGAGKSSLLSAKGGLIPRMSRNFEVCGPLRVSEQAPRPVANRFLWSIAHGIAPAIAEASEAPSLIECAKERDKEQDNLLLIFDQFEEVLTIDPANAAQKRAFFEEIGELLMNRWIWALFVLREDYLAPLDPYARMVPTHLNNRYRLDLLRKDRAQEAIEKTAAAASPARTFHAEAIRSLTESLSSVNIAQPDGNFSTEPGEYVEPLQLQLVCFDLWERLPEVETEISAEAVRNLGDVAKALQNFYDRTVETVGQSGRAQFLIRNWINEKLITNGRRDQVQYAETGERSEGLENALIGGMLRLLLLRREVRGNSVFVELSHDRLLEPVSKSNADWFESRLSEYEKRARLWEKEREAGLLYVDEDLKRAQEWRRVTQEPLIEIDLFLEACQARQRQIDQERKLYRLAIVLTVIALAATCFAVWQTIRAREAANIAAARQLLAIASGIDAGDSNLFADRALWTVASSRERLSSEGRAALTKILLELPRFQAEIEDSTVTATITMDFSPDGEVAAGVLGKKEVFWSKGDGTDVRRKAYIHDRNIRMVDVFSKDSIAFTDAKQIYFLDLATGRITRTLAIPRVRRLTVSPNGMWIAYAQGMETYLAPTDKPERRVKLSSPIHERSPVEVSVPERDSLRFNETSTGLAYRRGGSACVADVTSVSPATTAECKPVFHWDPFSANDSGGITVSEFRDPILSMQARGVDSWVGVLGSEEFRGLRVYDSEQNRVVARVPGFDGVLNPARPIVAANYGQSILFFRYETGPPPVNFTMPGDDLPAVVAMSGTRAVYLHEQKLHELDANSGQLIRALPLKLSTDAIHVSANGRYVFTYKRLTESEAKTTNRDGLRAELVDLQLGASRVVPLPAKDMLISGHGWDADQWAVSSDGKHLIGRLEEGKGLRMFQTETGAAVWASDLIQSTAIGPAWDEVNRRVAFEDAGRLTVLDVTGTPRAVASKFLSKHEPASVLAFRPDGKLLAVAYGSDGVRFFETKNFEEVAQVPVRQGEPVSLGFDSQGNAVVIVSSDRWFIQKIPVSEVVPMIDEICSRLQFTLGEGEWRDRAPNLPYRNPCPALPPSPY
ncbi:MAG: hypothetical protein JNL98_17110 [Bryobacterales bacterium]|nr:hypothetical protein [Bryobacterales bacterium]